MSNEHIFRNKIMAELSIPDEEFPVLAKYRLFHGPIRPFVDGGLSFSKLNDVAKLNSFAAVLHSNSYGIVLGGGIAFLGYLAEQAEAKRLSEAQVPRQQIDTMKQLVESGDATWKDMSAAVPELNQILHDPQVYPKLWRSAMHITASGEKMGIQGLPRTPEEMLAAGMDRPTYLPTKESINPSERPATTPITEGLSSGLRSVGNELHSSGVSQGPYSLQTFNQAI